MQLDMFGATDDTAINTAVPPVIAGGRWVQPESLAFNNALKNGSLSDAVAILNVLTARAAGLVLLSSGFSVGDTSNRATMMADIQTDLLAAARLKMSGYELRVFNEVKNVQVANNLVEPVSEIDKNIGREWNSEWGIQVVTERIKFNNGDLYEVKSENGDIRRYSVDNIEDVVKKNEYSISPEGVQKRADRDLTYRKQEEIQKHNEAMKAQAEVEKHEIDGFGAELSPLQLGKVKATLSNQVKISGEPSTTLKDAVRKLVANGGELGIREEDVIKPMSRMASLRASLYDEDEHEKRVREGGKKNVYYVANYDLGKIAYDYADYLIKNEIIKTVVANENHSDILQAKENENDRRTLQSGSLSAGSASENRDNGFNSGVGSERLVNGMARNGDAVLSKLPGAGIPEPAGDESGAGEGYSGGRSEPSPLVSQGSIADVRDQGSAAEVSEPGVNFNNWIKFSSVVTSDGEPLVVYHGSDSDFTSFDFSKAKDGAHFFTSSENHAASFGKTHSYYLDITNALVINQSHLDAAWDLEHPDGEQDERSLLPRDFVKSFVKQAKLQGRDGLIIKGMSDRDIQSDMYLPFSNDQIKLTSLFDFNNKVVGASSIQTDYVLTDDDRIGLGGLAEKFQDNLKAIRVVKALAGEKRHATDEERRELVRYVGWGGLKGVFDPNNKQWARQHVALKAVLSDAEWAAASRSQLDSFYTPTVVAKAMFSATSRLGFESGRVLEPSVGVGNFFGLMPEDMRKNSMLHGVELDILTSGIVSALYPSAKIAKATPFQNYKVPAGYYDMVVGNPPFGNQSISDDSVSAYSGWSIHNYFFAKSIEMLRPGGIMPMVVSHSFLDKLDPHVRQWISRRAELVSGVRLPNTAFKENANTEVVTDVLIFRRLDDSLLTGKQELPDWLNTTEVKLVNSKTGAVEGIAVNDYFINNPANVLGIQLTESSAFKANEYTVEPNGELGEQLASWVATLPKGLYVPLERSAALMSLDAVAVPDGVKEGSFYLDMDKIYRRLADSFGEKRAVAWEAPNQKALERMVGMISIKDSLRSQMWLERQYSSTDEAVEGGRKQLNFEYTQFNKKFGFLNDPINRRLFLDDTESALLQALEFDYEKAITPAKAEEYGIEERPARAVKADIMNKRVLFPPVEVAHVETAKDALLHSLNMMGRVDFAYMQRVYSNAVDEYALIEELGDIVYKDPVEGWVTADAYLSGDVKTKLAQVKLSVDSDSSLSRNIVALEGVIPKGKLPSEIFASIGAAWIPPHIYSDFAKEISGANMTYSYFSAAAKWAESNHGGADYGKNSTVFGTAKMTALEILSDTMNSKGLEVKKTVLIEGVQRSVTDEDATEAARQQGDKIRAHWDSWLWMDGPRADRLTDIYNDKFNRIVERKFDGTHLSFPGMSSAITLLKHQKDGVWRGLQDRSMLADQVVGAGKTYEMAAMAMEMRRLGIARKPMFAVPNHLTLQWRSEFYRLYPGANVLAATPQDFDKENRERLFSKIVTGNWDAVVIGHSSLKKIAVPLDAEVKIIKEQLDDMASAIQVMKEERGDRSIIRDMEKIMSNLESKVTKLMEKGGKKDNVVDFADLGIDALFIDECFPYDTPVLTNYGWLPIGYIVENKLKVSVLSYNSLTRAYEWKPVIRWIPITRKKTMVRISHSLGHFVCTSDHKIWTDIGYVEAGKLTQDRQVQVVPERFCQNWQNTMPLQELQNDYKNLPTMPGIIQLSVYGEGEQRQEDLLLGKLQNDSAAGEYGIGKKMDGFNARNMDKFSIKGDSFSFFIRKDEEKQSNVQAGSGGEGEVVQDWEDVSIERGKFSNHSTSEDVKRYSESGNGIRNHHRERGKVDISELAESLQSGYSLSESQTSNRGGREYPQDEKVALLGQEKDGSVEFSRVESVEVLESGDTGESTKGGGNYKTVYDIEVADNHNFLAAGVLVSNCHEFKNLFFSTQMNRVAGLGNPAGSGKAFDLFVKVRWLQDTFGERAPLITATGTPVSNSLSEMFTMQRYMQYNELKQNGLHMFDAWAKQYGDVQTVYEVAPSGTGYRLSQRFAKFKNLGSLMGSYRSFADVITLDDLKAQEVALGKTFPVPKLVGGKPLNVVAQRSELQEKFFGVPEIVRGEKGEIVFEIDLAKPVSIEEDNDKWVLKTEFSAKSYDTQADAAYALSLGATTPKMTIDKESIVGQFDNLRELTRRTKGKINALSLTGLANKAGLDYRIIDAAAPDFDGSKINIAVGNMLKTYEKWHADKGVQLAFCDLSVPLSAKAKMASNEKRIYVRDDQGDITHKKGTLHTPKGFENFPYYVVAIGAGQSRTFIMYDAFTGAVLKAGFDTKPDVHQFVKAILIKEAAEGNVTWLGMRERMRAIEPDEIDEYKNNHSLDNDGDAADFEFSVQDVEGLSSVAGFSVYDDIKAKLVAGGVPLTEVEFIHDHDTPQAKDALFKRVNAGEVRFLLGSTPKMGAGTNVQKKLVALHHIDAPWRPSDLEQREGRIIRRGNELYERDPEGFAVDVIRYATAQTYDTRRWQLLEHKAAGVEQLRNYDGANEIDDVATEASNSADMKAAASGNPLILKETVLATEVKKLTALGRSHLDGEYVTRSRMNASKNYAESFGPGYLLELKTMQTERDMAPVLGVFEGKKLLEKIHVQQAMEKIASSLLALGEKKTLIYRGSKFEFEKEHTLITKMTMPDGNHAYLTDISPLGSVTRMENFVNSIEGKINDVEARIAISSVEAVDLAKLLGKPFPRAGDLATAIADHSKVQRALMKANSSAAVKPEERLAFDSAVGVQKTLLRTMGFGDAVNEIEAVDVEEVGVASAAAVVEVKADPPLLSVNDELHYSDMIIHNLVESFGWEYSGTAESLSATKNVGGGDVGGELNPLGHRFVHAVFDEPRRRYLSLQSGFSEVLEIDCRDLDAKYAAEGFDSMVRDWAKPLVVVKDAVKADVAAPSILVNRDSVASRYAEVLADGREGVSPEPNEFHYRFADDILNKNAYGLSFLSNGVNPQAKKVFTEVTGIKLATQQSLTWAAIRDWAGLSELEDNKNRAIKDVNWQHEQIVSKVGVSAVDWAKTKVEAGFNSIVKNGTDNVLVNAAGEGFNLSKKGSHLNLLMPYIKAKIIYEAANLAAENEQSLLVNDGAFHGKIMNISNGIATQKINRDGDTVLHRVALLSRSVKVDELVDIKYMGGKGNVVGREVADIAR